MTELLETIFGELGIAQYLDAFLEQGFDTWETILDITESDLDALGVKLGHRRKLQRRIANFRGVAPDASLVSPTQSNAEEVKFQDAVKTESPTPGGRGAITVVVTKRKYRRHPKPDENAPERPPSAYVLFSNKMREELKGRNLSFAEIAKLVGVNWQNLTAAEKEPFESQAQAIKDKYLSDLAVYKQTPEYRKYQAYLKEFKAKHGSPSQVYHTPGSLLAHQTPNHHQYQHHGASAHHVKQTFPTHAPPAPGPPPESPQQGRQNASLDGMSALLKAGEIVDRSMQ
ncbi:8beffd24-4021-4356-a0ca-0bc39638bdda [Thermothielavioides terrestris]|uniref:8beffd24-4021-4356-a0ca-0bc39638bdda n=1 Tax=Thermothielavioides terrestris TaxID=2587410 RepID=A0A3S4AID1_9PEZI|nr:8beffd24-4021-4356-a0ca-0bc39638bdda [Thermothielavioides terrestris]